MTNLRVLKAQQIASSQENLLPVAPGLYRVRSQTRAGSYAVRLEGTSWSCECADFKENRASCKHIFAVVQFLAAAAGHPLPVEEGKEKPRPTYSQDWPSYDAAQQMEQLLFDPLLRDLLTLVPERLKPPGGPGRPPLPLRTMLFYAIRKVYSMQSGRRARGLLVALMTGGHTDSKSVPSYATPSRVFNEPMTTPIVQELIHRSALPFIPIEDKGSVGVDSSGFCTTCRGAYCTERHNPGRTHSWVKAHLVVGMKTHAVLSVHLTDGNGADHPHFLPLLEEAKKLGFNFRCALGDKAYLSRDNYDGAEVLGLDPFIPFKVDSTSSAEGCRIWREKFHQFQLHREEFDEEYHLRSNVEAAISAIKRKLGEALLSKNSTARLNELLAKLLAYNIGVLVHEMYEHGIDAGVPGIAVPSCPTQREDGAGETESAPEATPVDPSTPIQPPQTEAGNLPLGQNS